MLGIHPIEPQPAANPLDGTPIEYSDPNASVAHDDYEASDCTIWPVADRIRLAVHGQDVCVDASLHDLIGGTRREPLVLALENDAGRTEPIPLDGGGRKARRKIGVCERAVQGAPPRRSEIWLEEYRGCVRNAGLVSRQTRRLTIKERRGERWVGHALWELRP
jgi:hypothetical protein